ncbi:MAG: D-alanine--D-alanine ligase [Planctomycetota bacterium]|nr:D-alanine--D-alanine ligase [Planctomycetota bacterium]
MTERVDVVMGGPGREAAVSRTSGAAIVAALREAGCDVQVVDVTDSLDLTSLRPDAVVFNIIHGTYGEDGVLQRELEAAGRSYVGSDAAVSALCMDKEATKQALRAKDLPVPWGQAFDPRSLQDPRSFRPPSMAGFVLKPQKDGSSVGLHMLANLGFLLPALEQVVADIGPVPMLLEERLAGPEYTVAVIEDEDGQAQALPPICIVPASDSYDYQAKYESDDTRYEIVDGALAAELQALGLAAYRACGCRDFARVDVMADRDGGLHILEVNTLPGFTSHSLVPKAAAAAGIGFADLCRRLVRLAARRSN